MDIKRNVAGLFFVAVGGLGLLAACGEIDSEESCTFDDDCTGGQVCDLTVCVDTCETNADCSGTDECVDRPGGAEGKVCRAAEAPGDDCRDADFGDCPDGQVCNDVSGQCVEPGEGPAEYYTVRINDVTDVEGDDRCGDTTYGYATAGAKIMYVELKDDSGVIAYGEAVGDDITAGSDFINTFDVIDGSAPDLVDQCPADEAFVRLDNDNEITTNFTDQTVVALGCGGSLYVQFRDENDNLIALDESHTINVGEFGPACNATAQTSADYYDVYICTDAGSNVSSPANCDEVPLNAEAMTGVLGTNVRFSDAAE
ncbi:hypothetical protein EA187_15335 [Lujinxingia sediminis]|uniref:Uncharacterized protein n=1 Tax=Lujinxingia sediminis TaxID=2480984 RepID=A0ABY0CQ56_9DELT|nr:hypothetical protein [Lujinxingia sediminis]RVU42562.1 hypothetical protein EA187_15335 [Lujinxingia sediminis]